jgi:zinc protease
MRIILALFVLLLTFPAHAQTFGAQTFTLQNGMQVVVIPNHRAPVVTHMVWYKVGAAEELPGKSGMAHYLEHLLFKGTAKMTPGEFSRVVKTLGGNDNAFTSKDYTAYYQTISAEHLERMMSMEADRMLNTNPPEEHFKSEKDVVLEERRQRTDNNPRQIFGEQMNSALYVNHPYGTPVIGWMNEIEKYEWVDVKEFYDRWYAPNNAILVISGDVTAEKVKPLAEKTYGILPRKDVPERKRPQVAPANSQTLISLQDASIHQPVWQKLYIAPSESRNRDHSLALQVLSEIMDGGPTTRLYKKLVVDQKKATGVQFSYSAMGFDYGGISLSATPANDVDLEEIGKLVSAEIKDVLKNGVTEQETKDAIQRLQDAAIYARDSLTGPAMIFGTALTTGSTVENIENWPADIAKVTHEQVKETAQIYLNDEKPWIRPAVTGHLIPMAEKLAPTVQEKSEADAVLEEATAPAPQETAEESIDAR